ncbi:MAG: fimbrial subunit, partial [uncultured Phycisphaerae bacterium]
WGSCPLPARPATRAIRNPQSAIRNPQSAIRNPQSHPPRH